MQNVSSIIIHTLLHEIHHVGNSSLMRKFQTIQKDAKSAQRPALGETPFTTTRWDDSETST